MTVPTARRAVLGRALAGLSLVLAGLLMTGCGSPEEASSPEGDQSAETDAPPFAVKLDAPENAGVGDEVTVTLTNVGRLPDSYQLTPEPLGGARVAEPNVTASPGESVEVSVRIKETPVSIGVESVGGGGGQQIGQVTIN